MKYSSPDAVPPDLGSAVAHGGNCVVWALPPDETCAALARSYVRATLRALLPDVMVDDACTMVSELASNTFAHALGGLSELWIYKRGPRPEIVVKVFDGAPWKPSVPASLYSEDGRGLGIVRALASEHGGSWGVHRTRSRLGVPPARGKVVYVALPVPPGCPVGKAPQRTVQDAIRDVESALAARGLGPLHRCEGWGMAVLSVRPEITVWARPNGLSVKTTGTGIVCYPLSEVTEVAEVIVRHNENLDAR